MKNILLTVILLASTQIFFAQTSLDLYIGSQNTQFGGGYLPKLNGHLSQKGKIKPLFGIRLIKQSSKITWLTSSIEIRYNHRYTFAESEVSSLRSKDRYQGTYANHHFSISGKLGVVFSQKKSFRPYLLVGLYTAANVPNYYDGYWYSYWGGNTIEPIIHHTYSSSPKKRIKPFEAGFNITPGILRKISDALSVFLEAEYAKNISIVPKKEPRYLNHFENRVHQLGVRLGARFRLSQATNN